MNCKNLILFLLLTFCLSGQAFGATVQEIKQEIITQSNAMGVDPAIMLSLAKAESGFRQEAIGASGTVGVFQLMPSTAKGLGYDPYVLDQNIKCGITYYRNLYKMFGSMEKAVAAYNAGSGAVKRCNCIPSYSQKFVNTIMKNYNHYKSNM